MEVLFVDTDFTTVVDKAAGTKVAVTLKPKGKFDTTTVLAFGVSTADPAAGEPCK